MRRVSGHTPRMQAFGEMQSVSAFVQGNAHFWYCVLQWCRPHGPSFVQGRASGPGVDIAPPAAGAVGAAVGAPVGAAVG